MKIYSGVYIMQNTMVVGGGKLMKNEDLGEKMKMGEDKRRKLHKKYLKGDRNAQYITLNIIYFLNVNEGEGGWVCC